VINLKNVSLVTVDGVGTDLDAIRALKYSSKHINFGSIKYITAGSIVPNFCETIKIEKLTPPEYQKFCLARLVNYIDTEFIILIQSDGFIANPNKWKDDFLKYDYIGGPWPIELLRGSLTYIPLVRQIENETQLITKNQNGLVGNGGFTLRSKKILDATKKLYSDSYYGIPEDNVVSILMRKSLENLGIKFPYDIDFASTFSCESKQINGKEYSSNDSFGFHGRIPHQDKIMLLNDIKIEDLV
jgi:hypothetical protein